MGRFPVGRWRPAAGEGGLELFLGRGPARLEGGPARRVGAEPRQDMHACQAACTSSDVEGRVAAEHRLGGTGAGVNQNLDDVTGSVALRSGRPCRIPRSLPGNMLPVFLAWLVDAPASMSVVASSMSAFWEATRSGVMPSSMSLLTCAFASRSPACVGGRGEPFRPRS